jgi:putative PIN family toxin of toxin-antitoxin system
MRVVLDANVVLSALVFGGRTPGRLRHAWQQGALAPLVCTATAQELVRVLAYPKFRLSSQDQEELLADYLPYTETIQIPHPPPCVPECRYPMDLVFMQLAVAGLAKVLVSGEQDLLVLADEFARAGHCSVMTMEAFASAYPEVVS